MFSYRFEELKEIIKKTRNHKKIKDMAKILSGKLVFSQKDVDA